MGGTQLIDIEACPGFFTVLGIHREDRGRQGRGLPRFRQDQFGQVPGRAGDVPSSKLPTKLGPSRAKGKRQTMNDRAIILTAHTYGLLSTEPQSQNGLGDFSPSVTPKRFLYCSQIVSMEEENCYAGWIE